MMLASEIIEACAAHYGTHAVLIRTEPRGTVKVTRARWMAMYLTHVLAGYHHARVARVFGRDPSTVFTAIHGLKALHTPTELGDVADAIMDRVAASRSARVPLYTEGPRHGC